MEKNNIKYLIFGVTLIVVSLVLNYSTLYLNNIYIYKHFDYTGIAKIVQRVMTLLLLVISIVCLVKSIQTREKGVDFLFNKCMTGVFIIYTILSLVTYIYLRTSEENVAMKMKGDIESYSQTTKQNQLKKNNVKNNNSFENDFYKAISEGLAETEYMKNDENYERKKEVIEQVESSSSIERYISMLLYNPSYEYYTSTVSNEIKYYETFLRCFIVGIVGTIFYLFNIRIRNDSSLNKY